MAEVEPKADLDARVADLLSEIHPPLRPEHELEINNVYEQVSELCCTVLTKLSPGFTTPLDLRRTGAWKLGVAQPGAELDLVLVAPEGVLSTLADGFRQVNVDHPRTVVPDGSLNAPGIKFNMRGTVVKLLFASSSPLPAAVGPMHAALFGEAVANKILQHVPDRGRFCELLALIRYWAQQRGVFGILFGFFSGTAWAICCACICQMYPQADTAELLTSFFQDLCNWDWCAPIALFSETEPGKSQDGVGHGHLVVKLPIGDNLSAMPNMCEFALRAVQKELKRAVKLLGEMECGEADLTELFLQHNFFHRYRSYLQFDFLAKDEDTMDQWFSWGHTQIQELMQNCETMIDSKVTLRPWPCLLDFKDREWPCARAIFIGVHRQRTEGEDAAMSQVIDFREVMVKFLDKLSAWPEANGQDNALELLIRPVTQEVLAEWLRHQQAGLVVPVAPREPEEGLLLEGAVEDTEA